MKHGYASGAVVFPLITAQIYMLTAHLSRVHTIQDAQMQQLAE